MMGPKQPVDLGSTSGVSPPTKAPTPWRAPALWGDPNVPKRGWTTIGMYEDKNMITCAMCRIAQVRYVHTLAHESYSDTLDVGCVCAGKLTSDKAAAETHDRRLRSLSSRRGRWVSRNWKTKRRGEGLYLNTDGHHVDLFPRGDLWLFEAHGHRSVFGYRNSNTAALAAFDCIWPSTFDGYVRYERDVKPTAQRLVAKGLIKQVRSLFRVCGAATGPAVAVNRLPELLVALHTVERAHDAKNGGPK